jgi:tetratricopeptide (TPR) repeat protein
MGRLHQLALAAALLGAVLSAGCNTPSKGGYRPHTNDPDTELAKLYDAYKSGKEADGAGKNRNVYDAHRAAYEIEKLAVEFPTHVPTLFTCGAIAYELGQPEKASAYIDTLLKVQPAHPEAAVLRSRISIGDGNLVAAEDGLRQQVQYVPDHAGLREALAAVLYLRGDHQAAREELAMAQRLGAPGWRIAFNQGLIHEARGEDAAARGLYEQALEENPEFAPAGSRLAGLRAEAGEVVR